MIPQISARAPLAPVLLSLIAGLFLARHLEIPSRLLLAPALCGSLFALLLAHKKIGDCFWLVAFIISSTFCFWAYGNIRLIQNPPVSDLELPQREARLTLEVQTVLRATGRYQNTPTIARVVGAPKIGRLRDGDRVYAQLTIPKELHTGQASENLVQKGLQIQTTGLLTPIPEPLANQRNQDFDHYLKSIGVHYRFNRTDVSDLVKLPSVFTQFCTAANQRFQKILQIGAPEDSTLANVYVAMLLGNSAALSNEQRERYLATGTMHFFAISGLHIGVIAAVIAQCLLLVRVPRNWSPCIGLPLLYLYVEITGASPSAIRAFLMTAFFWAGFFFRRQHSSFAVLVNSAFLVLLIDPSQLWSLGFQLSYTVVASILLFGLPMSFHLKQIYRPYRWLPEADLNTQQQFVLWSLDKLLPLFAISFSAWIASMPLCAAFFNLIAPGAIVLNMALVCLVAITIIIGILSITCGTLLLLPVSIFVNHAAWLVIAAMDGIVRLGTFLPSTTLPNEGFPSAIGYAVLLAYFLSLFWLHGSSRKMKPHLLWLPVAILMGSMSLAMLLHSF